MLRTAVIKKCPKEDKDDRPDSEQEWCLFTHDGKRLLGRHPTKESAERQERAIQVHKHGSAPTCIKYRGAEYRLAEAPQAVKYRGAKYVLAAEPVGQQAVMWSVQQSAAVHFAVLVREIDDLNALVADSTKGKDPKSGNDYVVIWATPLVQKLKAIDKTLGVLEKVHSQNMPK